MVVDPLLLVPVCDASKLLSGPVSFAAEKVTEFPLLEVPEP
jgi:hypothetical protein